VEEEEEEEEKEEEEKTMDGTRRGKIEQRCRLLGDVLNRSGFFPKRRKCRETREARRTVRRGRRSSSSGKRGLGRAIQEERASTVSRNNVYFLPKAGLSARENHARMRWRREVARASVIYFPIRNSQGPKSADRRGRDDVLRDRRSGAYFYVFIFPFGSCESCYR